MSRRGSEGGRRKSLLDPRRHVKCPVSECEYSGRKDHVKRHFSKLIVWSKTLSMKIRPMAMTASRCGHHHVPTLITEMFFQRAKKKTNGWMESSKNDEVMPVWTCQYLVSREAAVEAPQVRYVVCLCILYWCVVHPLLGRRLCYSLVRFTCALRQCDVTEGGGTLWRSLIRDITPQRLQACGPRRT